ncbi:BnaC03g57940D [Brassica napus]|uniref:BnaC03g57940D protein n=1 Tax=Brassica napus TaxID=3708 RepID=A0A078FFP4_BRANA|nr:BnaC03g57940D [Brassica napus]
MVQAFHRHLPILIRELGSSYKELLHIISDPPKGSENLLTLVLQILTQEVAPSSDLIATVKHLYETKLKDVSILIPLLSLLTKDEVLPIFPLLLNLPPEKFQLVLAHILQGSAHTGPALTLAEVLIAIHDVVPEKNGPPLKKITDACSACFEQRTVFTQQVLAKALGQMAIDAFPTLVSVVLGKNPKTPMRTAFFPSPNHTKPPKLCLDGSSHMRLILIYNYICEVILPHVISTINFTKQI